MDTIGEQLKQARLEKGLTMEDLQKITKIQRRYLSAIEVNDFDAMPSDYYTKTFIRQYAEAVGLNARPLIRRFEGKPDETQEELPQTKPIRGSRKEKHRKKKKRQPTFKDYLPITLLSLVVIAIIGTIIYAMRLDIASGPLVPKPEKAVVIGSDSKENKEESTSQSSPTDMTEKTKDSSKKKKNDSKFNITSDSIDLVTYSGSNVSKPIKLDFTALEGPVWIGLQQSGTSAIYYQYTLQAGEEISSIVPEDATGIDIIVGASNNLSIKVNDQELAFNKSNPTTGKKIITINFDTTTKENE